MERTRIGLVVCVALIAILAFSNIMFYFAYQTSLEKYSILWEEYGNLTSRHLGLKDDYERLKDEHISLQNKFNSLTQSYNSLQRDYEIEKESYNSLQRDYEIEKVLRIGNSLESYYDYLRQEVGPTGFSSQQTRVNFAANLALHDIGRIYWPRLAKEYYENVGEYSYETARKKLLEVLDLIEIRSYDTPTNKIRKILEFVSLHINYEPEVNDVLLAPVETLGFKSGDCDDFSILTAALFEITGIDSAIGYFRNKNDEGHVMVLVHLEDLPGYRYWFYSDLTGYGLEKGKWIIIEPQTTIDYQGTDWIEQWMLSVAAPLDTD